MTDRKLLRRAVLTAAITSAPLLGVHQPVVRGNQVSVSQAGQTSAQSRRSVVQAAGSTSSQPASPVHSGGIQQVQYQPGAAAQNSAPIPAPNPAVLQELNRLFEENGQQMPPMGGYVPGDGRQQAGAPSSQRPTHRQPAAQNSGVSQSTPANGSANHPYGYPGQTPGQMMPQARTAAPPKKNMFQKLVGKFRGESDEPTSPVVPPASPMTGLSQYSAPPPSAVGGVRPQQPGTSVASQPQGTPAARMNPGGAIPLPQTRVAQQPAASRTAGPGTSAPAARGTVRNSSTPQYVQPGNGPAFVKGYVPAPTPAAPAASPAQGQPASSSAVDNTPIRPAPVAPVSDDFVDPFDLVDTSEDGDEMLDLDALIEIPAARQSSDSPQVRTAEPNVRGEEQVVEVRTTTTVQNPVSAATPNGNLPDQNSADAAEANPFTGVRLPVTDEEFFREVSGATASQPGAADGSANGTSASGEFSQQVPELAAPAAESGVPEAANPLRAREISLSKSPVESSGVPVENVTPAPQQPRLKAVAEEHTQISSEQSRREQQRAMIVQRSGQTGFKGFCPVLLRDERELVDASSEFHATFGLQEYTFSSQRARAAFEADPARYAPAAGGSDVVLLVNTGEEQSGMLDYSLWYRDRLYLFCSRETMGLFSKDPARFANQY